MNHVAPNGFSSPCHGQGCRICALIDRDGPHYREPYRRLFFPGEFPDAPAPARPGGPSLARKAMNFSKALIQHAVAGLPTADQETAEARMEICKSCPSFDADKSKCLSCGCQLNVKIYWSEQKCPLGKW